MSLRKLLFGGFLFIGLLIAGFLFLLRGCLSKYDERSAITPALFVEKDGKGVIFSLVRYEKATSYSQKGGFTSKSVSTSYFVQNNDPQTGAKLGEQKIKHHSDIKNYPVETLGSSAGLAWVFMGELMAFDPFTLEKKADKEIIESKNPLLKGKLPDERRYYFFNTIDRNIIITANDGTSWQLNTNTLTAASREEMLSIDPMEARVKMLEELLTKNRRAQDSLYQNESAGKLYAAGKITQNQYAKFQQKFFDKRDSLYAERDSLQKMISFVRKKGSAYNHLRSAIESLQRHATYQQIKTNQDTLNGQWRGLYSKTEMDKLSDDVRMQTSYDETARRQLYASVYTLDKEGDGKINKAQIANLSSAQFFLQGGFLLDKKTALPVRLDNGLLIVHKDKIGNEGKILLSRVDNTGKAAWTFGTNLREWLDWIITKDRIFIFGADNTRLSSNECNLLWTVDLASGKAAKYDYFTSE